MLTSAQVRNSTTLPLVLALCCIFLSACTNQQVLRPYQYKTAYSEDIHIAMKSGQEYHLRAPWTSDALGNISGKGEVCVDGEWSPFDGDISFGEIEEVSSSKFTPSNPALIYGLGLIGVMAIALGIWAALGAPL